MVAEIANDNVFVGNIENTRLFVVAVCLPCCRFWFALVFDLWEQSQCAVQLSSLPKPNAKDHQSQPAWGLVYSSHGACQGASIESFSSVSWLDNASQHDMSEHLMAYKSIPSWGLPCKPLDWNTNCSKQTEPRGLGENSNCFAIVSELFCSLVTM